MPWFIKTETFTEKTLGLPLEDRRLFLDQHKSWVREVNNRGIKISSGYLVDKNKLPGGGGVLIIEVDSYEQAILLIQQDPLIAQKLVNWEVQEWMPVAGNLIK